MLCESVLVAPQNSNLRRWTLRMDYYDGRHHAMVSSMESPLYLDLSWRPDARGPVRHVGIFKLDLRGLLRGGYVRHDPMHSTGLDLRLQVKRTEDGHFFIQGRADGPRIQLLTRPPLAE